MAAAKPSAADGGGRVLARAKNNLGLDAGGFAYDLEPLELAAHPGVSTTRVCWGAALEGTARELLGKAEHVDDPDEQSALQEAKDFLLALLVNGPLPAKQIMREAGLFLAAFLVDARELLTRMDRAGTYPIRAARRC